VGHEAGTHLLHMAPNERMTAGSNVLATIAAPSSVKCAQISRGCAHGTSETA